MLAQQTAKVPRDRMEVLVLFICPLLFFNKKNQMYFSRVGGCSTYLPSSTESFVSGKSRGSTASTTAGTATRIIRCAVNKFQFLIRFQPRWSQMSGFTTWSNSLFMRLSQSGNLNLDLISFKEKLCCKFCKFHLYIEGKLIVSMLSF